MRRNPWVLVILVSLFILILTSLPKVPTPETKIHFLDKIAHFVVYFIWGFSLSRVWRAKVAHSKLFTSLFLISIILFPAFDELHQYLIPERNPSFLDWFCDIAGAISSFSIFVKWKHIKDS